MLSGELRRHIETVRDQPDATAPLRRRLRDLLGISSAAQIEQLERGLNGAIDAVPQILEQVSRAGRRAGIAHLLAPILRQVGQYFLDDEDLIPDLEGTLGLLDDAYLAHAYLHQINVAYQDRTGHLLLPVDPTATLQVLCAVLGPEITGQLDEVVRRGVRQAVRQSHYEDLLRWNRSLSAGDGAESRPERPERKPARTGEDLGIEIHW